MAGLSMRSPRTTHTHTVLLSDVYGRTFGDLCSRICTDGVLKCISPRLFCSNRYGFVEFDDPRDADDAVYDLNGKELCGERVIVEHTKGPRRDGGYGGGGGGGGGGRSRCPLGRLNSHVLAFIAGILSV